MQDYKPFFLTACSYFCRLSSGMIAGLQYRVVYMYLKMNPGGILISRNGLYEKLRDLWFTRLFRRIVSVLVRTPLRLETLSLVNFEIPLPASGCVVVTCHTPWARLLVQWCLEKNFALIIASGKWIERAQNINKRAEGFRQLRQLVRHVRLGGRIVIIADVFSKDKGCSTKFFETECYVSLLPARLARIAKVPLIAMLPELDKKGVSIHAGPHFTPGMLKADACAVMHALMNFFEKEIKRTPAVWSHAL